MKSNFSFSLRGGDVRWPIWGILIASLLFGGGMGVYETLAGVDNLAPSVFDWHFVGRGFGLIGGSFIFSIAYLLLGFFVMKRSIEATAVKDAAFETDYDFRRYAWLVVKGVFFSCITFGIYLPWFATKLIRFYADGASHRFNLFGFNGRPMTLFGLTVLMAVLPSVVLEGLILTPLFASFDVATASTGSLAVLWIALILVAYLLIICIYQTLYYRWFIDFNYGERRIVLKMSWWQSAWFLLGQLFLTVVTLGLYWPMFWLRTLRYYTRRMVLGDETVEERFGMSLRPWRDWGYIWCQTLLTIITLGIYMPWAYARISNRFVPRCYVEDAEGAAEPMPVAE